VTKFSGRPQSASAGSFVDGRFVATPEGQLLLDYLNDKFGIPLEVRELGGDKDIGLGAGMSAGGIFTPRGVDESGYGGSLDKKRRVVQLAPGEETTSILAHEAGHAYDPALVNAPAQEEAAMRQANPLLDAVFKRNVPSDIAGGFLERYMGATPSSSRLAAEAVAQKNAAESLKALGIAHPEMQSSWYREYPNSYVESGLDKAYALMANPYAPGTQARGGYMGQVLNTAGTAGSPVDTVYQQEDATKLWDMSGEITRKYANLGLNPSFAAKEREIQGRASDYLDRMIPDAKKTDYVYNQMFRF